MPRISASSARQTLPSQLDLVEAGEEIEITRHGRVVAVLVHPDVLGMRRRSPAWDQAGQIGELLDDARMEPLPPRGLTVERAEQLVREIREDRSAR